MSVAKVAEGTPVTGATGAGAVFALPAGTQAGDFVMVGISATGGPLQATPAGWSILSFLQQGSVFEAVLGKTIVTADLSAGPFSIGWATSTGYYMPVGYINAQGQPTGYAWVGGGPGPFQVVPITYRSSSGACVIDAMSAMVAGTVGPAVTTTVASDQIVSVLLGFTGSVSQPVGWNNSANQPSSVGMGVFFADTTYVGPGSTGTTTWPGTITGTGAVVTVALETGSIAPLAPTPIAPTPGSAADATQIITYEAGYNPTNGAAMSAYALRVKVGSGSYQYYNPAAGGSLQAGIIWNALVVPAGGTIVVNLPANLLANGHADVWAMNTQESTADTDGSFCADQAFTTALGPTVTVNTPSGTIGTPEPTIGWTAAASAGNILSAYRVVIYTAAQQGVGGFLPGVSPSTFDTGLSPGAVASLVTPIPLANTTTFYAYVQVTQSNGMLSPWEYTSFLVTYTAPATPTLVLLDSIPYPGTDQPVMELVATGHDAGYAGGNWIEVQRSLDGGNTWADLRYGALLTPSASEVATVYDTEAPPGTTILYRSRVITTLAGGILAYSLWSTVAPGILNTFPFWVLSNPLIQGMGMRFNLSANPTKTLRQVDTEYDPLSRSHGIKMSDGWKGSDWSLPIRLTSLAEQLTLEAIILSAGATGTLLLQHPLGAQFYCTAIGNVAVAFNYSTGQAPVHDTTLTLREVATP